MVPPSSHISAAPRKVVRGGAPGARPALPNGPALSCRDAFDRFFRAALSLPPGADLPPRKRVFSRAPDGGEEYRKL